MEKRGLSAVVVTIIMVLLALVAVGVVWAVVGDFIGSSGKQVDIAQKCVTTHLEIESINCDSDDICTIKVKKAGGYKIDGIQIVLSNETSEELIDEPGDIELLKTFTIIGVENPDKVSMAIYFRDFEGEKMSCTQLVESLID